MTLRTTADDGAVAIAEPARAAHLVPLPGGPWAFWRPVCLRAAGFPATHLLRLAAPQSTRIADALIEEKARARRSSLESAQRELAARPDRAARRRLKRDLRRLTRGADTAAPAAGAATASLREELERVFAAEELEICARIQELARGTALREAVLWQNRHAVGTAIDPLLDTTPGDGGRKKRRAREVLVASYLQRYCVKNDSIGFFGPVGWGRFVDDGPAVRLEPGPALVTNREVYFESWGIDTLARRLSGIPGVKPWVAPKLLPQLRLDGRTLRVPQVDPVELTPEHARLLRSCDGRRSATAIAESLVADPSSGFARVSDVFELLEFSEKSRLITWSLEGPLELRPERRLRERLQAVPDEGVRASCLASLDELEAARAAVAHAAGDALALERALEGMEATFTRLTDTGCTRRHGETYAARTLLYEDCHRDVTLELGGPLLSRLGPPLSLALAAGRWAIAEMGRRYLEEFERAYRELAPGGTGAVDLQSAIFRIPSLAGDEWDKFAIRREVQADVQRRWAAVLELPEGEREVRYSTASLRPRVADAFAPPAGGWRWPRYISPDVMIAAPDAETVNRGGGQIVLGEIHLLNTLLHSCLVSQHPDPAELLAALERDHPAPCVLVAIGKQDSGQRTNFGISSVKDYLYDNNPEASGREACRELRPGELLLERGPSGLEVRTTDGRARFPVADFFGHLLSYSRRVLDLNPLSLPPAPHSPRVLVDGVVFWRERWQFAAEDLGFAREAEPVDRFLAARRWALAERLPRFVFFKVPIEWKPCYADLDSPLYVEILSKLVRNNAKSGGPENTVSVTEMLPLIEESWLVDAEGRHYTSELRIAALEVEPQEAAADPA
jgi:hypothetical protein